MSIPNGSTDGEALPVSSPIPTPAELQTRLEALAKEVAFERECFEESDRENAALRAQLHAGIDASDTSQLGRLRLLYESLDRQFALIKRRPSVSAGELAALEARIASLAEERTAALDQLSVLTQEIDGHRESAKQALAQTESQKKKLEEANRKLTELNSALAEKNRRLDSLTREARVQRELAERHETEKWRLERDLKSATDSVEQLSRNLTEAKRAETTAATHIAQLTSELETNRERIKELEMCAKDLELRLETCKQDLHAAEQLTNDVERERQQLSAELAQRAQVVPAVIDLHEKIEHGLSGLTALFEAVEGLRKLATPTVPSPAVTATVSPSESLSRTEEIARIRKVIADLEKERSSLQATNNQLDERQSALRRLIQQAKTDLDTGPKKNAPALRLQIQSAESEHERISRVRDPIQERLVEIEQRTDPLRHRLELYRDLEQSIEAFLEPLPEFTLPSLEDQPEPPLPEPPSPPEPKRRTRATKPPPPTPMVESDPQPLPSTLTTLDASVSTLQGAARRHGVRPLAILAVSLYEAVERRAGLDPTPVELFEAARDAGIWNGPVITCEEDLTDGKTRLRSTELSTFLSLTLARNKQFYAFRPQARLDWLSPITPEQRLALNAALHRRKHR